MTHGSAVPGMRYEYGLKPLLGRVVAACRKKRTATTTAVRHEYDGSKL